MESRQAKGVTYGVKGAGKGVKWSYCIIVFPYYLYYGPFRGTRLKCTTRRSNRANGSFDSGYCIVFILGTPPQKD